MPGTYLSALYVLSHLIFTTTYERGNVFSYFPDGEIETQGSYKPLHKHNRSPIWEEAVLPLKVVVNTNLS